MDLETTLLQLLADPTKNGDIRINQHGLFAFLAGREKAFRGITAHEWSRLMWKLINQGLIYIDISSQPSVTYWTLHLTERGRAAVSGTAPSPDFSAPYLRYVRKVVPVEDPVVFQYAEEAHRSYLAMCYVACVVMLGVASETAMLGLFDAFGAYLDSQTQTSYTAQLQSKKMFAQQFAVFRKFWGSAKLPDAVKDNSDLWINAVADMIRRHRNEAGHAVTVNIDRDAAYMLLSIFPNYLGKVYEVKAWLLAKTSPTI